MNILFIGDVVGQKSCANLREKLPLLKKEYNIDTVIVNGENSADGNGITPVTDNTFSKAEPMLLLPAIIVSAEKRWTLFTKRRILLSALQIFRMMLSVKDIRFLTTGDIPCVS